MTPPLKTLMEPVALLRSAREKHLDLLDLVTRISRAANDGGRFGEAKALAAQLIDAAHDVHEIHARLSLLADRGPR